MRFNEPHNTYSQATSQTASRPTHAKHANPTPPPLHADPAATTPIPPKKINMPLLRVCPVALSQQLAEGGNEKTSERFLACLFVTCYFSRSPTRNTRNVTTTCSRTHHHAATSNQTPSFTHTHRNNKNNTRRYPLSDSSNIYKKTCQPVLPMSLFRPHKIHAPPAPHAQGQSTQTSPRYSHNNVGKRGGLRTLHPTPSAIWRLLEQQRLLPRKKSATTQVPSTTNIATARAPFSTKQVRGSHKSNQGGEIPL